MYFGASVLLVSTPRTVYPPKPLEGFVHASFLVWSVAAISLLTAAVQYAFLLKFSGSPLRRELPIFFGYLAAYATSNVAMTVAEHTLGVTSTSYFWLYWVMNTVLILLEFGIMHEVFVTAVKPYAGLADLARMLFLWAAAFLFIAAALTGIATSTSGLARCIAAIVYISRGLRLMQCGMLLLFFFFERRLGLSWRSPAVSAALGLSVYASVALSLTYFRNYNPAWSYAYDIVENTTYLAVVCGWFACFTLPQPTKKTVLDSPSKLIFQRWNDALLASPLVPQGSYAMAGADSFLPSVERTVERVMARKMVN